MATSLRAIELMARADWMRLRAKGAAGPIGQAREDLLEAIDICRAEGEPAGLIVALQRLGRIERDLEPGGARARNCYLEAADLCRRLGDKLELAHCRRALGELEHGSGALGAAEANYAQALSLYEESEDAEALDVADTLRGLALAKEAGGQRGRAFTLWRQARDLYDVAGAPEAAAEAGREMARLLAPV